MPRTGAIRSSDLGQAGFENVMGVFEWQGFAPPQPRGRNSGERPGMASFAQIRSIRALWSEWTRGKGDEAGLNTWLERCFKASSLRFVKKGDAARGITALKATKSRAG